MEDPVGTDSCYLSEDVLVSSIARETNEKFGKYWKDCSLVLAIAVVMDPRFKMKLIEFSFSKLYGEDAPRYVKVVSDAIRELYFEYVAQPLPLTLAYDEQAGEAKNSMNCSNNNQPSTPMSTPMSRGDGLLDFDIYISEMAISHNTKPELEQYLEEALVPRKRV